MLPGILYYTNNNTNVIYSIPLIIWKETMSEISVMGWINKGSSRVIHCDSFRYHLFMQSKGLHFLAAHTCSPVLGADETGSPSPSRWTIPRK